MLGPYGGYSGSPTSFNLLYLGLCLLWHTCAIARKFYVSPAWRQFQEKDSYSRVAGQGHRSSLIYQEDRYLLPLYKDEQGEHCHTKQSEAGFMKLA